MAGCSPAVSHWQLLGCSLSHWNVTGILVKFAPCPTHSAWNRVKRSISVEFEPGQLTEMSVPSLHCGLAFLRIDFWLIMLCTWVLVKLCFLVVRRMRLRHCIPAWLWLCSDCISRRGSDRRMLSYWRQKSLVPVSAGALVEQTHHFTSLSLFPHL